MYDCVLVVSTKEHLQTQIGQEQVSTTYQSDE